MLKHLLSKKCYNLIISHNINNQLIPTNDTSQYNNK